MISLSRNALILTKAGFKYLEKISIGDRVYTHTGSLQKIIDKSEHKSDEPLFIIKSLNSLDDLILSKDQFVNACKCKDRASNTSFLMKVDELKGNDFIYSTFPNRVLDKVIADKVVKNIINDYKDKRYVENLPIFFRDFSDEQLKRLFKCVSKILQKDKKSYNLFLRSDNFRLIVELKELLLYLRTPCTVKALDKSFFELRYDSSVLKNNMEMGYFSKIIKIEKCAPSILYKLTVENDSSYLTINYTLYS
jgi:hypothetical protein